MVLLLPRERPARDAVEAAETARLAAMVCRTPIAFARVEVESGTPLLGLIGLDADDVPTLAGLSAAATRLASGSGFPGAVPLGLQYVAAAPVRLAGGATLGFLMVAAPEPRESDPSVDAALRNLARRLAEGLDLRRQARDLRSAEAALSRVQATSREVSDSRAVCPSIHAAIHAGAGAGQASGRRSSEGVGRA